MAGRDASLVDRLIHRRALRRWERVATDAGLLDPPTLRSLRAEARELRRRLDRALHAAEDQIALPGGASLVPDLPLHADWAWRPDPWRLPMARAGLPAPASGSEVGPAVRLFHDSAEPAIVLRQMRNAGAADRAPFALALDVYDFPGSFLSFAIDLPEGIARSLRLRHILQLSLSVLPERPIRVYARLNIRHGPNTEQMLREVPLEPGVEGEGRAEFDLAYGKINEKRVEAAWVDIILESPGMNRILVRDAVLSRRPRAEL
jgi:hypothetical protein